MKICWSSLEVAVIGKWPLPGGGRSWRSDCNIHMARYISLLQFSCMHRTVESDMAIARPDTLPRTIELNVLNRVLVR